MKGFVDRRQFMGSAAAHDASSGYDGIGQAQLVRSKQATALELVDSAIARIEAANPKLNAVVWEMFEHARTPAPKAPSLRARSRACPISSRT
jgi:Asp-tRNA(Asn)/Glu-tRNA(Gln) amidotransferase A subunit family amidase